ncbi:sugar ABC transporter ATP-binding protein [Arthrobacter humicola]|uniref:Sugar ABC transporter ATP-binding protein n=2 Tax=Actinomycetes TaxID=1760 RepID=A0ABN2YT81_9MICC
MTTDAISSSPLVQVRGLQKNYGAIRALRGVDIDFNRGEIHGLVGANGAGKSTLVRSLAGLEQPDAGEIIIRGEPTVIHDPGAATDLGFAFIHQELNLVASFTGAQNIMLGSHTESLLRLHKFSGVPRKVKEVAERIGIDFSLDKPVSTLTVHQQWLVSIARALVHDCQLLAMDEPTASLGAEEADKLLNVARDLAGHGVAVLFISHRLDEVTAICDRVTVFRDGAISLAMTREEITRQAIVEAIVGHNVVPGERKNTAVEPKTSPVVLTARNISRGRNLRDASLDLHRGELLGIAGLVGSGRTELARVIFGADRAEGGAMMLHGSDYAPRTVNDAVAKSVAYVPEERRAEALFLNMSIESNLHITTWDKKRIGITPLTSAKKSRSAAKAICERLGVVLRNGGTSQPVGALSGGNQQKVVIGRWMAINPEVLILDEPTRGVDIGARSDIYARIREIAKEGTSVIVISSEFEELLECDRVIVLSSGATVAELTGEQVTVNEMLRHCYA